MIKHLNFENRSMLISYMCIMNTMIDKWRYGYAWWRHQMEPFLRYCPFVRGIHRSPVNSLHKGQWRGALMFSLICAWINGWVNNGGAGDLRSPLWRHCKEEVRTSESMSLTYVFGIFVLFSVLKYMSLDRPYLFIKYMGAQLMCMCNPEINC